ncbi:hypothetical protein [Paenibacillus sp. KN14-4R]|uniref:hypothetical protein n=1 Tax=Paenibacillus sp. KN14-4R TaxID=3445773 RepID=UPI003F9F3D15
MFSMEKISKKLARFRKQSSISQLELADQIASHYQAMSEWILIEKDQYINIIK